jgi:hypothetical protein
VHHQHHRQRCQFGDRRKIPDRIEWYFCKGGIGGEGEGRHQERMSVGRSPGDRRSPDGAACARTVVDDHRLTPAFRKPLRHQTGNVIGGAPRHERDDKLDLLARKGLGRARRGKRGNRDED